jgi:hypothetical protein
VADSELFGNWLNPLQEDFTEALPKLPSVINDTIEAINTTLEFLLSLLDIALAALQVVKAFLIGYIDPIAALIEALIAEIEAFLRDLRGLGLYISGDFRLIRPPYSDLLGGFSAFENRMIRRFVDKTDPSRPVLSSSVSILGLFVYASGDLSNIPRLLRFLTLATKLINFDLKSTKATLTPVDLRVLYGREISDFQLRKSAAEIFGSDTVPPELAEISWGLSAPVLKTPILPFPVPPPHGFLIEVSTVRDGLPVFFDRPLSDSLRGEDQDGGKRQGRSSGRVLDPEGNDFTLFGGVDQLEIESALQYNNAMEDSGKVKDGASRIYVQRTRSDKVPIPLDALKTSDGRYLLQRTFFLPTTDIFGPSGEGASPNFFQRSRYNFTLSVEDLPFEADFEEQSDGTIEVDESTVHRPLTVYARVSIVSDAINSETDFRYVVSARTINAPGFPYQVEYDTFDMAGVEQQLSKGDKGQASIPVEVNFPAASSTKFIELVQAALAVLILSRSDLEVGSAESDFEDGMAATSTGLENLRDLVPQIISSPNPNEFFELADDDSEVSDVEVFRATLLDGVRGVASELYRRMGSTTQLEELLLESASILTTFQWSDAEAFQGLTGNQQPVSPYEETILGSLEDFGTVPGIARGPLTTGLGIQRGSLSRKIGRLAVTEDRIPGFYQKVEGRSLFVVGSADNSPVLSIAYRDRTTRLFFCRNLFPQEIYQAARQVLGVAASASLKPTADGEWIALRLASLFPPLDAALDTIFEWARTLGSGTSSIVDAAVEYIEFLESRILELQSLLDRIDSLIDSIITIQLPSFASIFLAGNGADEILAKFVSSGNKPVDSITSYGVGFVWLFTLGPSSVIDLIDFLVGFFTES